MASAGCRENFLKSAMILALGVEGFKSYSRQTDFFFTKGSQFKQQH
jgi:hypothetical protein